MTHLNHDGAFALIHRVSVLGTCPLGLVALEELEVGVVVEMDCGEAIRASEQGDLVVSGQCPCNRHEKEGDGRPMRSPSRSRVLYQCLNHVTSFRVRA
jgi:hypothetical protein